MKIQYHSDLHIEYNKYFINKFEVSKEADILVFAGDIGTNPQQVELFFRKIREQSDIPILYALGNHEYYGHDLLIDTAYLNITQNIKDLYVFWATQSIEINNISFIGSTLYSDLSNPLEAQAVRRCLNDFRVVKGLDIEEWQSRFDISSTIIDNFLFAAKQNNQKSVVITHFAPLRGVLTPEEFKNSPTNAGFCSDLLDMIIQYQPKVWIYGHTHSNIDYQLEETRIVSNQYGYPWEDCGDFQVKLIKV